MQEAAAEEPDRETLLYEYLKGLIEKDTQSAIEGLTMNVERENVSNYEKTPKSPPMARYEGLQALEYLTAHRIPLIGAYSSGAMIAKQEPGNFTIDPKEIAALMEGKGNRQGKGRGTAIKRFYFIPADAGFLCLDIDRKPGKRDGLEELYRLFPKDTLPRALQDIDRFFPCHVTTPSGGYHLYFKYSGTPVKKTDLAPEVEIKHGKPGLTAPGSYKENGTYVLHGELADAPPLYGIILDRIAELQKQRATRAAEPQRAASDKPAPLRQGGSAGQSQKPWPAKTRITLDILAAEAKRTAEGNHNRQVSFAGRACRCEFPYNDALGYVKANPGIFGNGTDTENTIKSVYRDKGAL
jgi:hypothetical protein